MAHSSYELSLDHNSSNEDGSQIQSEDASGGESTNEDVDIENEHHNDNLQYGCFISPNINSTIEIKKAFMLKHPIQINDRKGIKLPFEPSLLYWRSLPNGEKIHRKWLSYSVELNQVYCSCCMAFADNRNSTFITGQPISNKHVHKSVEIHENSQSHRLAATAAFQSQVGQDISSLLSYNQAKIKEQEVRGRRLVLERLIDIIIFIGRQGIAFRGDKGREGAHTLESFENHGNFLELVLLVAKYDVILQNHVNECVKNSKAQLARNIKIKKQNKSAGQLIKPQLGRGSLLTFLSKSFINKLIKIIGELGRDIILKELHESVIYSLMVDSTQDVAVMDQLAICVRYVTKGKISERLLNLKVVDYSSGLALFEIIKSDLANHGISISNIVACSFDGASNMKGQYNGLQSHLKLINSNIVFTHCMGHVLQLILADSIDSEDDLFGLVEETSVFLSASHKRMSVWEEATKKKHRGHDKLYRIQKFNATRWWSKHRALSSIIDEEFIKFDKCSGKLIHLFTVLNEIAVDKNFDGNARFKAKNLMEHWSKFSNNFKAFVVLDIFLITSPISKYLQSKNLNYATAWSLVDSLLKQIESKRCDDNFDYLYERTKKYAAFNQSNAEENIDVDFELDFKQRRIPRKKKCLEKRQQTRHLTFLFLKLIEKITLI